MKAALVCIAWCLLASACVRADQSEVEAAAAELFGRFANHLEPEQVHERLIKLNSSMEQLADRDRVKVSRLLDGCAHPADQCTMKRALYLNAYLKLSPSELNSNLLNYLTQCRRSVFSLCVELEAARLPQLVADLADNYADDMMFIKGELRQRQKSFNLLHTFIPRAKFAASLLAYLEHKLGNLKRRSLLDERTGKREFELLFRAKMVPMCEAIESRLSELMQLVQVWDERNELEETMDGNLLDWLSDFHVCSTVLRDTNLVADDTYEQLLAGVNWATRLAVGAFGGHDAASLSSLE